MRGAALGSGDSGRANPVFGRVAAGVGRGTQRAADATTDKTAIRTMETLFTEKIMWLFTGTPHDTTVGPQLERRARIRYAKFPRAATNAAT